MSEDNVTSILSRFAGPPPKVEQHPQASTSNKTDYRAAEPFLASEERHFILGHMSNGSLRLVNYAYFVEAISTAPNGLAFVYTNGVLFLRGPNIRALLPQLQQKAIKALHPFDATRHTLPDEEAPVIEHMEWRTKEDLLAQGMA